MPVFLRGWGVLPVLWSCSLHARSSWLLYFISTHRAKGKGVLWPSPESNVGDRGCALAGDEVCRTTWCPPFPKVRLKRTPVCMGTACKVPPEGYSTGSQVHESSWFIEALAERYLQKLVMYCKTLWHVVIIFHASAWNWAPKGDSCSPLWFSLRKRHGNNSICNSLPHAIEDI